MRHHRLFLGLTALFFGLITAYFLFRGRPLGPDDLGSTGEASMAASQFELARTSLALTENLDAKAAVLSWDQLYEQRPNDVSVLLNRALNRVLHVDALTEATTNALLSAEEKQAARRQLPDAIDGARNANKQFATSSGNKVLTLWLDSRVDLQEASLLPASLSKSLRQEIFERLSNAIQNELKGNAQLMILGGPLMRAIDELESPINGLPPDIQKKAAETTLALSDQEPDNLFIALRAARLGISAKQTNAASAVERTRLLASAIEPSIRPSTQSIGLTPDELVQKILDAIKAADWQTADNQINLWFNVLNGTDLVKTDRRRSSPHPLDRLSFTTLRELSAQLVLDQSIAPSTLPLQFQTDAPFFGEAIVDAIPVDIDLNLVPDVVTITAQGLVQSWSNDGKLVWTPKSELDLKMDCDGLLAADLFMVDASDPKRLQASAAQSEGDATAISSARHNTFPTLLAFGDAGVKLISVDGRAATDDATRLSIVAGETGLEALTEVTAAIAGDLEGDGDLDLIIASRNQGLRLFINRGNRTFFEPALTNQTESLSALKQIGALAIVDLDRDLDLDVVTLDQSTGQVGLLENLLHLQFRYRELKEIPPLAGANQIVVADIDGNVSWDIVIGGSESLQMVYSTTSEAGAWVVEHIETQNNVQVPFVLADFDNDSWQESLHTSEALDAKAKIVKWMGSKNTATASVGTDVVGKITSTTDFNLDGKLDLLLIKEGKWQTSENLTESPGHHMAVRFRGIDDNNANSGRVNHYAIGSVVELRFGPHYRAHVITSPSTHFGLDGYDKAASLRVIFPNGLTQTMRDPSVDMLVEEEQTLKGSCPYLYAWDGERYAFVTDCLWAAPLGLQVAAGVVAKDRPWEYLKVDGDYLKAKDGYYELRITEELWEVAYFDHLSLTAVDHPSDVEIQTNEKVGPGDIAEPKIYSFHADELLRLKQARSTDGTDVTETLLEVDQEYLQAFDRRLRQGLCPPHWIDLDFGVDAKSWDGSESIYLVMTGWILPTDTSLNIQIDQNPELPPIEFPSVWVPDSGQPDGWRKAIPFMGFPGGKTKTIVVDVTDSLNREDPRLRVRTSAQIYWDSAKLAIEQETSPIRTEPLTLASAELQYHGFSKRSQPSTTSPDRYDYADVTLSPKWPPLQGEFTRFGDCEPLLKSWDDQMVVMGSGDELRLLFKVPEQQTPVGWKRDFVLHCVGWDKDADLNTLTGQSSLPLPYKLMGEYPPLHSQNELTRQTSELNAEHLLRVQSFRQFWHR